MNPLAKSDDQRSAKREKIMRGKTYEIGQFQDEHETENEKGQEVSQARYEAKSELHYPSVLCEITFTKLKTNHILIFVARS
jgi:hypothetical protein